MPDHPIIITRHARERYVIRAVDPVKFAHLNSCRGCDQCVSLLYEVNLITRSMRRHMDRHICRQALDAVERNEQVTDPLFIETVKTRLPKDYFGETNYYIDRSTPNTLVFVVKREEALVLKTVLTWDMIDGMVLRHCHKPEEFAKVFRSWKHQTRIKDR